MAVAAPPAPFFAYVDGDQFAFRIDPLSKRGATTQIEVARDVFHLRLPRNAQACDFFVRHPCFESSRGPYPRKILDTCRWHVFWRHFAFSEPLWTVMARLSLFFMADKE